MPRTGPRHFIIKEGNRPRAACGEVLNFKKARGTTWPDAVDCDNCRPAAERHAKEEAERAVKERAAKNAEKAEQDRKDALSVPGKAWQPTGLATLQRKPLSTEDADTAAYEARKRHWERWARNKGVAAEWIEPDRLDRPRPSAAGYLVL